MSAGHWEFFEVPTSVDDLGGNQRITLGADKGYDRHGFVQNLRDRNVTPGNLEKLPMPG
jgi:hypothetical protein